MQSFTNEPHKFQKESGKNLTHLHLKICTENQLRQIEN